MGVGSRVEYSEEKLVSRGGSRGGGGGQTCQHSEIALREILVGRSVGRAVGRSVGWITVHNIIVLTKTRRDHFELYFDHKKYILL